MVVESSLRVTIYLYTDATIFVPPLKFTFFTCKQSRRLSKWGHGRTTQYWTRMSVSSSHTLGSLGVKSSDHALISNLLIASRPRRLHQLDINQMQLDCRCQN